MLIGMADRFRVKDDITVTKGLNDSYKSLASFLIGFYK